MENCKLLHLYSIIFFQSEAEEQEIADNFQLLEVFERSPEMHLIDLL